MYKSPALEALHIEDPPGSGQWKAEDTLSFTPVSMNGKETDTHPLLSTAYLYSLELPEPEWLLEGIVPTGLTFLAGQPKRGKSWLTMQLAKAVATGTTCLDRNTRQGRVIYICLEDGMRRTKSRAQIQQWTGTEAVNFLFDGFQLGAEGMVEGLEEIVRQADARLVAIDSLSSARGVDRRISENDAELAQMLYPLSKLGQDTDCAFIVVHHMPKLTREDPGIDLRGTSALFAACDAVIGLYRKQGENLAKILAVGRDYEEDVSIAAEFTANGHWLAIGHGEVVEATRAEKAIIKALEEIGESDTTAIAKELGKSKQAIARYLPRLTSKGLLAERQVKSIRGAPKILYSTTSSALNIYVDLIDNVVEGIL